jgi:hypothetical protein
MTPQNIDTQEITRRVWSLVDAVPHRAAIQEADARGWVEEVVALHGEAAIWHAIRLSGFGGSEIGILVRNHCGVRADHQASAHDIVAGKLMRKAPTETSGHMTRGHENEEPHARRFYTKYGAARDVEAFNALKDAQGKRLWMRYSPDDVVQMPVQLIRDGAGVFYPSLQEGKNRRWLIDYKSPSKVEQSDEVAFQYACQLSQGAILCAEAGIHLDGMMLSQFDWANWLLKDDVVNWDQSLGQSVLDAGDHYWGFVTSGQLPPYISTPEASNLEGYKSEYLQAAEMFSSLAALADAAKKRADEIRVKLLEPVNGTRLAGQKVSFGLTGIPVLTLGAKMMLDREAAHKVFTAEQLDSCSGKNVYNADKMEDALRAQGVDMSQYRVRDLDATKVYALAASLGLDPDHLVAEQLTLTPDKTVKQRMAAYIEQHYPLSAAVVARDADGAADGGEPMQFQETDSAPVP